MTKIHHGAMRDPRIVTPTDGSKQRAFPFVYTHLVDVDISAEVRLSSLTRSEEITQHCKRHLINDKQRTKKEEERRQSLEVPNDKAEEL